MSVPGERASTPLLRVVERVEAPSRMQRGPAAEKVILAAERPSLVRALVWSLVALVSIVVCGCRGQQAQGHLPNVVLITIDTLRADHCSCYGYRRATTPEIDKLAGEGYLVERAYTPMPTTGPAHAALFTSQYPRTHGVVKNGQILRDDRVSLAEILRGHGYRTAAFVSSFVLNHQFGYAQGFTTYDDDFSGADSSLAAMKMWEGHPIRNGFDRRANETTDKVIDWLRQNGRQRPFFLWVHYFDPHYPYAPPESARRSWGIAEDGSPLRRALAAYDAEIAFTDREVGRLVQHLDDEVPPESTLLVITADHGEGFLHGYAGHGAILYEETVHIPLLFCWRGRIPPGQMHEGFMSLIDIAPTVLGLLKVEHERVAMQGRDFSCIFRATADSRIRNQIFLQRRHYKHGQAPTYDIDGIPLGKPRPVNGPMFGIRSGRWKYIEAQREGLSELFDVEADTLETRNLADEHPETARKLHGLIAEWRERQPGATQPPSLSLSKDARQRLESLGYVE
jgi:choline-sulfatase